jgi:hypothetical protein
VALVTRALLADNDAELFCEAVNQIGPEIDYRTVENGRELFCSFLF